MGGLGTDTTIFIVMVFIAVVLLMTSVIVPTVGSEAQATRRMKGRIDRVLDSIDPGVSDLLKDRTLGQLTPLGRALELIPGMTKFRHIVEQSGSERTAVTYVLWSITLAAVVYTIAYLITRNLFIPIPFALVFALLPILLIIRKRARRLAKFEEQLPEALDLMARALQAGHPFNETLKMVGDEMKDPIAGEFMKTFTDINYGLPVKTAFVSMLARVPSISLNTLVTAVLIQQESGGRIAEILMKIAAVIRGRFKLNRRVRSLSAEGRMSAWVLTLLPFALALLIAVTTPSYIPRMTKDPLGIYVVAAAFGLVIIGNFWIRKIIRFKY